MHTIKRPPSAVHEWSNNVQGSSCPRVNMHLHVGASQHCRIGKSRKVFSTSLTAFVGISYHLKRIVIKFIIMSLLSQKISINVSISSFFSSCQKKKKENYRGQKPNKHAGKRSIKVIWMNGRIKVNYFASGH
jgi:hypothetical protein